MMLNDFVYYFFKKTFTELSGIQSELSKRRAILRVYEGELKTGFCLLFLI